MNRRHVLATAAGTAAASSLPFALTAEETVAYQDALDYRDVSDFDHEQTWLWERWFGLPEDESGFPGIGMAPEEFMAYEARLNAVIALAPDILNDGVGSPLCEMDEAVMAYGNAVHAIGMRTGMALEHLRLASLHRELREPGLTLTEPS